MKDTFYFQHDYNARNDPKLQRLFMKHGVEGLGIFWCLVEMLYEQGGQLENNLIDVIAYNLRVDETTLRSVVFELNLFVFDDTHFWSERVRAKTTERNNYKTTQKQRTNKGGAPIGNKNACKSTSCNDCLEEGKQPKNNLKQPNETTETTYDNKNNLINNIREDNIKERLSKESPKKVTSTFRAPSVDEVREFSKTLPEGEHIDANEFCDFYASKGWMVGKNQMRDWQAAVRRWARENERRKSTTQPLRRERSDYSVNESYYD